MSAFPVYYLIKKRRSVRVFRKQRIKQRTIRTILDAGRWAPSGLNNQPWRFVLVRQPTIKDKIARCTEYSSTIRGADCIILVFLDRNNSYHLLKDAQAIGACIQNILLSACEMGIGTCWMGEILNQKNKVNAIFDLAARYDLMAALALGYPQRKTKSKRLALTHLIIKEYL